MASDEASKVLSIESMASPFAQISNIAMLYKSKEVDASNRQECQETCETSPHCKSASWRPRDSKCFVSGAKLEYRPHWKLNIKETKMAPNGLQKGTGNYNSFDSVLFHDTNFPVSESDARTCKIRCDTDDKCGSYSFEERSGTCYLGSSGVQYDPEFVYFEPNPTSDTNDQSDSSEPLPEKEATPEEEEEMKEPHFTPPDDSAFRARLQKTHARIAEIDKMLDNPNAEADLNPKKEKERKDIIRHKELQDMANAGNIRKTANHIHELTAEDLQYQKMLRETEAQAPAVVKKAAEAAFAAGIRKAESVNGVQFDEDKKKILKQRERAQKRDGVTANGASAKIEKEKKEQTEKRASLEKNRAKERVAEIGKKHQAHAQAIALSKQAFTLISDEGRAKAEKRNAAEKAQKEQDKKIDNELAEKTSEREEKKVMLMKTGESQQKSMAKFSLQQAIDHNEQLENSIRLRKKEQAYKQAEKEKLEARQRRIDAAQGAEERSRKDEVDAANRVARASQVPK
jgi:hypothetical protein